MKLIKKLSNYILILGFFIIASLYLKQIFSNKDENKYSGNIDIPNISGERLYVVIKEAIDGDTFDVVRIDNSTKLRVRLIGVNTPESVDKYRTIECYGKEASEYAKTNFSNQKAYLVYDDKKQKQDNHGRELAYINIIKDNGGNHDLGAELLRLGLAKEYTYNYEYYQLQEVYRKLQKQSKVDNIGLWKACM